MSREQEWLGQTTRPGLKQMEGGGEVKRSNQEDKPGCCDQQPLRNENI